MSTNAGLLTLTVLVLLAACLVLWQRGNVHKVKRYANAAQIRELRADLEAAEYVINEPCPGCDGEEPLFVKTAKMEPVTAADIKRTVDRILTALDEGEL